MGQGLRPETGCAHHTLGAGKAVLMVGGILPFTTWYTLASPAQGTTMRSAAFVACGCSMARETHIFALSQRFRQACEVQKPERAQRTQPGKPSQSASLAHLGPCRLGTQCPEAPQTAPKRETSASSQRPSCVAQAER